MQSQTTQIAIDELLDTKDMQDNTTVFQFELHIKIS